MVGIPANVNGHSGDRDRCAHRGGAGVHFLDQPFTISQVSAVFFSWNLLQWEPVGVVQEAVEDSIGQGGLTDEFVPVLDG